MDAPQEADPFLKNTHRKGRSPAVTGQNGMTRKFLLSSLLVLLSITWVFYRQFAEDYRNNMRPFFQTATKKVKVKVHDEESGTESGCSPPQIPLWHRTALKYNHKVSINCASHTTKFTAPLFSIHQGNWLQHQVDLDVLGLSCFYSPFFSIDYITNTNSTNFTKITLPRTEIPSTIEFIEVICQDKNNSVSYRDAFFLVHKTKAETFMMPSQSPSLSPLNVVIIGLDSTSRLNFKRLMPRANAFLLDELGAVDLEEFSVVGAGTRKNEIPLLSGHSFGDAKKECAKGAEQCRSIFLFNDFAKMGYITSRCDDGSSWTLDEPTSKAFQNSQPPMLTYYNRPLEVYMKHQQKLRNWLDFCSGPRLTIEPLLNSAESVTQVGRDIKKPHFQVIWSSRMTHDEHNALALMEPSLLDFLHNFMNSAALNDTVLLVLADHGQVMEYKFWNTPEGKHEYSLPLAYVVLPPWFKIRYPEKFANLKENARQKMITAFDIHATLQEILHLSDGRMTRSKSNRGISVFAKIPHRKCMETGISLKYCRKCYPDIQVKTGDPLLQFATNALLNEVNGQVKGLESKCFLQSLRKTVRSVKWDPRDVYREMCNIFGYTDIGTGPQDFREKLLNVSCDGEVEMVDLVDVELTTSPVGARYQGQVLVRRRRSDGQILNSNIMNTGALTDNVQRLDIYRKTGYCVELAKQPYCICKPKLI